MIVISVVETQKLRLVIFCEDVHKLDLKNDQLASSRSVHLPNLYNYSGFVEKKRQTLLEFRIAIFNQLYHKSSCENLHLLTTYVCIRFI